VTIETVTRYGEAVDLSVVLEPVQQGGVEEVPVLVQRLKFRRSASSVSRQNSARSESSIS